MTKSTKQIHATLNYLLKVKFINYLFLVLVSELIKHDTEKNQIVNKIVENGRFKVKFSYCFVFFYIKFKRVF